MKDLTDCKISKINVKSIQSLEYQLLEHVDIDDNCQYDDPDLVDCCEIDENNVIINRDDETVVVGDRSQRQKVRLQRSVVVCEVCQRQLRRPNVFYGSKYRFVCPRCVNQEKSADFTRYNHQDDQSRTTLTRLQSYV